MFIDFRHKIRSHDTHEVPDSEGHEKCNTQAGNLFRLVPPEERVRLIANLVDSLKAVPREIQDRQVRHFSQADPAYGEGVAKGLGLSTSKAA